MALTDRLPLNTTYWNFNESDAVDLNVTDTTNVTATSLSTRDETLAKAEIALMGVILYLAIFGNSVVLLVLKCRRAKLTRMQWFIVHLCLADISVALFNVLPQMAWDITYRFQGSSFTCKVVKYLQLTSMYASSYVLVMTALDRFSSICYPLASQTWTTRRVHIMISTAWILSLAFSIPQLIIFSMQETYSGSGEYDCWETLSLGPPWKIQVYITWIFLSIYAIPLLILAFAYIKICHVVWVSVDSRKCPKNRHSARKSWKLTFRKDAAIRQSDMNSPRLLKNPRAHSKGVSKSKIKTVKLTVVVVTCYFLCWGPFFVAQTWGAFDINAPFNSTAFAIILLLASLNSCVNPWIFLAFSSHMCTSRPSKDARPSTVTSNSYLEPTETRTTRLQEHNSFSRRSARDLKESFSECSQSNL
ncbi:cephalotocin receptor 1-like [Mizuhopecten yessoensis]|uniref:Annetocin receptor n=1 Tax=Mizuhopecten yessoensis TaxID=6573 RepID=A0A210QLA6_MIZYE|nr:cephalotocin receptor 1-like [Mizuhopecten yessoensis]OWF49451.1 Annetocin receptor [Mizuhopecten yessoensis]